MAHDVLNLSLLEIRQRDLVKENENKKEIENEYWQAAMSSIE
jgi:hypothetical protein